MAGGHGVTPWKFRVESTGRPLGPMAGVLGALLTFPALFALRLAHDHPDSALLVLLIAPVGILAFLLGWRVGLASAAVAFLLVPAWTAIEDTGLHALGYATYGAAFLTAAALGRLGRATRAVGARSAAAPAPGDSPTRSILPAAEASRGLSQREKEVLRLLALGYTNKQVGQRLFISARTVESHRAHIHAKLGCGSRPELVRFALERGLIEPSRPPDVLGDIPGAATKVGEHGQHAAM
jgi:DNA-binding CsgD family transcriptional regulator